MSEKDLTYPANISVLPLPDKPAVKRAKAFKVVSSPSNFSQYQRTVRAYMEAGLPFEHIANAGDSLNDSVERIDLDASFLNELQNKAGEIAADSNRILAWQSRGEKITIMRELPSANESGNKIIPISGAVTQTNQPQSVDVLEGIAVVKEQPIQIKSSNADYSELTNSPFLKAAADFKKAA